MVKKPIRLNADLKPFLAGRYAPASGLFDEQQFMNEWHLPFFLVFNFIWRFNRRVFAICNGDTILSQISSEIWLYNVGRHFSNNVITGRADFEIAGNRSQLIPKCNAYSIAQSTGIPSQTVRRKVKRLVELGWVERSEKGELFITAAAETSFAGANVETMRDFYASAKMLFKVMPPKSAKSTGRPAHRRKSAPKTLRRTA